MRVRRWLVGSVAAVASAGCTSAADGTTAEPRPADAGAIEPEDVRIDLAPQGMAASIVAPHDATARATADGVELRGGDDFHLLVGRGALDPLVEKARIVRRYGEGFRRFVRDEGTEVVYETAVLGQGRFHFFFTTGGEAALDYHCHTADEGAASLDVIEVMLEACRDVRFRDDVDPGTVGPPDAPVADRDEPPSP